MATSETRVFELALIGLESEKRRIEEEIADIRRRLGRSSTPSKPAPAPRPQSALPAQRVSHNRGKKMTVAQKRKISQTMKARWASRKRQKAA